MDSHTEEQAIQKYFESHQNYPQIDYLNQDAPSDNNYNDIVDINELVSDTSMDDDC